MIEVVRLLEGIRRRAPLSGGRTPAGWRRAIAGAVRLSALARCCAWLKVVIDTCPELRNGPLFGTALTALTSETYDAVAPRVAAAPSGAPGGPARLGLLSGRATPPGALAGSGEAPTWRRPPEPPSTGPSQSLDGRVLTRLLDLPRQATRELLGRLAGGRPVIALTSARNGDASTSSFRPGRATPGRAPGRPRRQPERGLRGRDGRRKQRPVTAVPGDRPDLLVHTWASRAARRAAKTIHRAFRMDAAGSESTTMPECTALAPEWSSRVDGRSAPPELLTAWAGASLTDASSGVGRARRPAATVGPGPDAGRRGASASLQRSFAPSSAPALPADDLIGAPAANAGNGPLRPGTPRATPSAVKASPLDAPAPPAPLTISPPVVVERLPALIAAKPPGESAPHVASLLAVDGARDDAARTSDDLSALADKIKRILDGQARRHGINV